MKNEDTQVKITNSLLSTFIQCAQNNPNCDFMTWAMANQELARVVKTSDTPDIISVRAKGDDIAKICDNMSKICDTAKEICYNCTDKQR